MRQNRQTTLMYRTGIS